MINRNDPRHVKTFLNTSKARRRRRIRRNIRLGLFFTLIVSCIIGFVYLSNSQKFQLKEVKISGLNKLNNDAIKEFVLNDISQNNNFFGLVSTTSTIFISESKIERAIIGQYPRIESVEVNSSFKGILEIKIVERVGKAKWCGFENDKDKTDETNKNTSAEEVNKNDESEAVENSPSYSTSTISDESNIDSNSSDTTSAASTTSTKNEIINKPINTANTAPNTSGKKICYEFDEEGYVFDEVISDKGLDFASDSSENTDMLNKDVNQSTEYRGILENNPIGQRFLDKDKLLALSKVTSFLQSVGLPDEYISCETTDLCTIKISKNGIIHIDISHNIEDLVERLKAVLNSEELSGVDFLYVDARYGNKVFYKTQK